VNAPKKYVNFAVLACAPILSIYFPSKDSTGTVIMSREMHGINILPFAGVRLLFKNKAIPGRNGK
jgi:hypothetical protein